MKKARNALVLGTCVAWLAALGVTPQAQAVPAPSVTSVTLKSDVVREPGSLLVTVRADGCITQVTAWAWSGVKDAGANGTAGAARGTRFTVRVPFGRAFPRGTAWLTSVTALRCGTRPTAGNPWNVEWDGFLRFSVR